MSEKLSIAEIRDLATELAKETHPNQRNYEATEARQRVLAKIMLSLTLHIEEQSAQLTDEAERLKTAVAAGIRRLTEEVGATAPAPAPADDPEPANEVATVAAAEIAALPPEVRPPSVAQVPKTVDKPVDKPVDQTEDDPAKMASKLSGVKNTPKAHLVT